MATALQEEERKRRRGGRKGQRRRTEGEEQGARGARARGEARGRRRAEGKGRKRNKKYYKDITGNITRARGDSRNYYYYYCYYYYYYANGFAPSTLWQLVALCQKPRRAHSPYMIIGDL